MWVWKGQAIDAARLPVPKFQFKSSVKERRGCGVGNADLIPRGSADLTDSAGVSFF